MTITPTDQPESPISLHKNRPALGPVLKIPSYACYACFDTGIVLNYDRAINDHLPDYDIMPSGQYIPGSDPAVICCCLAAYAGTGRGSGFRDSSGPRRVESTAGLRLIGCELPSSDAIATIHRKRRQLAFAAVKTQAEQLRRQIAAPAAINGILPSLSPNC